MLLYLPKQIKIRALSPHVIKRDAKICDVFLLLLLLPLQKTTTRNYANAFSKLSDCQLNPPFSNFFLACFLHFFINPIRSCGLERVCSVYSIINYIFTKTATHCIPLIYGMMSLAQHRTAQHTTTIRWDYIISAKIN